MLLRTMLAALALMVGATTAQAAPAEVRCEIVFDLAGWSFFYHTSSGRGVVTCSNGQRATVALEARGGGISFGKRRIEGARGRFSEVRDISEVFGAYAQAEAHAGAVRASTAQVVTRGEVSLAVAGTGQGVDLGIAFGRLAIEAIEVTEAPAAAPAADAPGAEPPREEAEGGRDGEPEPPGGGR